MVVTKKQSGFTIVELLIVVVVIAILAAITIVSYNGIQGRANDSSVQADLRNIATTLQNFSTTQGAYPASAQLTNGTVGVQVNKSAYTLDGTNGRNLGICVVTSPGDQRFVITGASKSGSRYYYTSQVGLRQYTAAAPGNQEQLCAMGGITYNEAGAWSNWGAETGQPNGWFSWAKG